jgi:hypothetical protein
MYMAHISHSKRLKRHDILTQTHTRAEPPLSFSARWQHQVEALIYPREVYPPIRFRPAAHHLVQDAARHYGSRYGHFLCQEVPVQAQHNEQKYLLQLLRRMKYPNYVVGKFHRAEQYRPDQSEELYRLHHH